MKVTGRSQESQNFLRRLAEVSRSHPRPHPFVEDYRERYGEFDTFLKLDAFDFEDNDIERHPKLASNIQALPVQSIAYIVPRQISKALGGGGPVGLFLEGMIWGLFESPEKWTNVFSVFRERERDVLAAAIRHLGEIGGVDPSVADTAARHLRGMASRKME